MSKVSAPVASLVKAIESGNYVAPKLDWDVLNFLGLFVVKGVLSLLTPTEN